MRTQVVTFHGVGPRPAHVLDEESFYWLDADHFEKLLDVLISYPEVQITFDDGNLSDKVIAAPELIGRKLKAMFFVCSARLGKEGYLDADAIRSMNADGFVFGSHGHEHVPWKGLGTEILLEQLRISKSSLESILDHQIETAACPFGSYSRTVVTALQRAGFARAYTSDGGTANDGFLQARVSMTRAITPRILKDMLDQPNGFARQLYLDLKSFVKSRI